MAALQIEIPDSFVPERKYALHVLFEVYMGISIKTNVSTNPTKEYRIHLENGKHLIIKDGFFSSIDPGDGYLFQKHLPQQVISCANPNSSDQHIVAPFGEGEIQIDSDSIQCNLDIIASTFFFITRWEEHVIEQKDRHLRTLESETYMLRHGLQHRPLVNEYVGLLKELLSTLGMSVPAKTQEFQIKVTHDVDHIARYDSVKKLARAMAGDIILRKNPFRMVRTMLEFTLVKLNIRKDNYDTIDWLMDISEGYKLTSHFYFIPSHPGESDARYDIRDPRIASSIERIQKRDHVVGLHGSYTSFDNPTQFSAELNRLRNIGAEVKEGRQHYLRFSNPTTWQIWNFNKLTSDSSIGYNSDIGFKAGTCLPYPVYDIINRKQLALIEYPLIIMEVPLIKKYASVEKAMEASKLVIDQCRKHNGQFVFLWHPENFNHPFWGKYRKLYTMILDYATAED
jgi:hypothetical protein